ncbi:hypothetical protein, partial [Clostridium sp.]|uniref:hypothetical protein n=1 Tax=Clostridium sp. TaxID=1506 RepID=UPI001A38EF66
MLKNKFYRTLLVVGITGSLIISTGVVAFASSTKSTTTPKTKISSKSFGKHQGEGNAFTLKGDKQRVNPLVSVLKAQVTAGTITQAKSEAITSFLTTKEAAEKVKMAAEKTKLAAMTVTERQTYMEANKPIRENIITELVTANLLTQDQATKIKAAMPQKNEDRKDKGGQFGRSSQGMKQGNPLAAMLNSQVTAKVITQAKSDQVTAFLKTKEDAEKAKLDTMTITQKEAYMKANRPAHEDIFAALVTAGILNQTQVDKIKASMPQRSEMGNWNGQRSSGAPTNITTATE